MTDAYLIDLADKCARVVMGRGQWLPEDWEDAAQEAAVGILEASKRATADAYLFQAGRHQICEWLSSWLRHPRGGTILEYLEYAAPDTTPRQHIPVEQLRPLLARRKGTHDKGIEQEIEYLRLLLDGYSIAGIGMEMCLSRRNVYAIRERLLPRLESIYATNKPV